MPYGTTRSPPNVAMSAPARACSPASQASGSGCRATVPSPWTSSITQYPTPRALLADDGMFHSGPYCAPTNANGPPLPGPLVFDPLVFDPLVFDPLVFGPLVFDPLVFGPLVFDPLVFGPLVFGPLVFGPLVFGPLVFDPLVPGHDALVGDGAISPPNPLRALPAAP